MQKELDRSVENNKSSWDILRELSRALWNAARQEGKNTRFGHPDELAEHVVFRVRDFFKNMSLQPENDPDILEMEKAINQGRYSAVLDYGQRRYEQKYLPLQPGAKRSLVEDILNSLEKQTAK